MYVVRHIQNFSMCDDTEMLCKVMVFAMRLVVWYGSITVRPESAHCLSRQNSDFENDSELSRI